MTVERDVRRRFQLLAPALNERTRRLWAATEAQSLQRGGVSLVARATGISRSVIAAGLGELKERRWLSNERIRQRGGGRRRLEQSDPLLRKELENLVDPGSRGDPESSLRWTCKSVRKLAAELVARGHAVSHQTVAELLREMDYSLQGNRKNREGGSHPDRDAQFQYIARQVRRQQRAGGRVISVDTKKKERVGDFKNAGREWRPKGRPEEVRVHDFIIEELGRATPYGIYDLTANRGWVSVGIDHDTSEFAVESIRWWWRQSGCRLRRRVQQLLITADCGGSNGNRVRLWKWELQKLADEAKLAVRVCHFPPGTSKWNKVEHRLFSFITQNWRGKPLTSHATIVSLIGSTRTRGGLKVTCRLDRKKYPSGLKITNEQMASIRLKPDNFHGEWNYTIHPRKTAN
jgi:hypothetical protein